MESYYPLSINIVLPITVSYSLVFITAIVSIYRVFSQAERLIRKHLWNSVGLVFLLWPRYIWRTFLEGRSLIPDLISLHLIRRAHGSIIISYHANGKDFPTTSAEYLHERIRFAGTYCILCGHQLFTLRCWRIGKSVYWQKIFQNSSDPTFVLLTFIWHALYAWDEALEHLYEHVCTLVRPQLLYTNGFAHSDA